MKQPVQILTRERYVFRSSFLVTEHRHSGVARTPSFIVSPYYPNYRRLGVTFVRDQVAEVPQTPKSSPSSIAKIPKKLKTLFTTDPRWFYRYYTKHASYHLGYAWSRLIGRRYWTANFDGTKVKLCFYNAKHHANAKSYHDNPHTEPMLIMCMNNSGKIFYDIGGYEGVYGIVVAVANPQCQVTIFEPDRENARHIRGNIDLNHLTNCDLKEAVVSDTTQAISFSEADSAGRISEKGGREVSSHILEEFDEPSLIKIDAEGAEVRILSKLKGHPQIICELHPHLLHYFGDTQDSFWETLKMKGYKSFLLDYQRGVGGGGEQIHYLLY